jgi:hypothetical protein
MARGCRIAAIVLCAVLVKSIRINLFQDKITADTQFNAQEHQKREKDYAQTQMDNLAKLAALAMVAPTFSPTRVTRVQDEIKKASEVTAEFNSFLADIDNCQGNCDKAKELASFLPATDAPSIGISDAPTLHPTNQPVPTAAPTAWPTGTLSPTAQPTFTALPRRCDLLHFQFTSDPFGDHDFAADFIGNYKVTKFKHGGRPIFEQYSKAKYGSEHIQIKKPNLIFYSVEMGNVWVVSNVWKKIRDHQEGIQMKGAVSYIGPDKALHTEDAEFPYDVHDWVIQKGKDEAQHAKFVCGEKHYKAVGPAPTPPPTTIEHYQSLLKKQDLKEKLAAKVRGWTHSRKRTIDSMLTILKQTKQN